METISQQTTYDFLVKQTFDELRTNDTLIQILTITFDNNVIELIISFGDINDYFKYIDLYRSNYIQNIISIENIISIKFSFGNALSEIFKFYVQDITPDWIMQNLPPNVLTMDYYKTGSRVYQMDKLPRNLNLLILSELENKSDLTNLPNGLTKLNLYNCFHVKHNLYELPSSLKLLILPGDYCKEIVNYELSRTYHLYSLSKLPSSLEIICYGRLKMTPTIFKKFMSSDYDKYNKTFNDSNNIVDTFLSELIFGPKKYFIKNYEYNANGWYHLAA
jgi:hypothetical protein